MTYGEKLKDPRWQKKRLEIFNRDEFTCQLCGDKTNTLHVHHKHYTNGAEPWEYPESSLITYCGKCHLIVEFFLNPRDYLTVFGCVHMRFDIALVAVTNTNGTKLICVLDLNDGDGNFGMQVAEKEALLKVLSFFK